MNDFKVIVLGTNYSTTLGVVRALGEQGIKSDLFYITTSHQDMKIVSNSIYIENGIEQKERNDEKIILRLCKLYADEKKQYIIIPTSDYTASLIDKNYNRLKNIFLMPNIEGDEPNGIIKLMDKSVQTKIASRCGLLSAKEWSISLEENTIQIPKDIIYPCYVKPLVSVLGTKGEMSCCYNEKELLDKLSILKRTNDKRSVLIQEYLDIEYEYIISGLCANQEVFAPALVKKHKVAKRGKGLTVYGEVVDFKDIKPWKEGFINLLKEFHYTGLFDLEIFKCKNGKIYFNEMNFRASGINYAITRAGVNLPYCLVCSLLQKPIVEFNNLKYNITFFNEKVAWTDYMFGYIEKKEFLEYQKASDFMLLDNEKDRKPFKMFKFIMLTRIMKRRLKNLIKS